MKSSSKKEKPEIAVFSLDYGPEFVLKPGSIALEQAHLLLSVLRLKKKNNCRSLYGRRSAPR
jgi:hypothetical protein